MYTYYDKLSSAAADSGKRAGTPRPVDTGRREAVFRSHLSPRARRRSRSSSSTIRSGEDARLAFLTVGFHSIKAARSNPVESLRYE